MDKDASSLLDAIFGSCECIHALDCTSRLDRSWGVVLWAAIAIYVSKAVGTAACLHSRRAVLIATATVQGDLAAILQALASSLPQFFISLMATMVVVSECGIGVVVGTAVFNCLAVPGLAGFIALSGDSGQKSRTVSQQITLEVEWFPVVRDSISQCVAVAMLIAVVHDGEVKWWEAVALLLGYAGYCLLAAWTPWVMSKMDVDVREPLSPRAAARRNSRTSRSSGDWDSMQRKVGNQSGDAAPLQIKDGEQIKAIEDKPSGTEDDVLKASSGGLRIGSAAGRKRSFDLRSTSSIGSIDALTTATEDEAALLWPTWAKEPLTALLQLTLPTSIGLWPLTLAMSILSICLISYSVADAGKRLACVVHLNPVLIGLLPLSAAIKAADVNLMVALLRCGEGDVATSNALSSNVFDLFCGTGLAWLLRCLTDTTVDLKGADTVLVQALIALLAANVLLVTFIAGSDWMLSRSASILLLLGYLGFVAWYIATCVLES
mmetsp:Transcript_25308/g.58782  ORF Transcript_25308/g.58782 Transcript_25308/m.58782 type:complete len:492 (+) Transcript_25308:122-1597(+)